MENHLGLVWQRTSNVLCMNVDGFQNMEQFISQELKTNKDIKGKHLESVTYSKKYHQLRLYFTTDSTRLKVNNYVKQVSKKKHPDLAKFLEEQKDCLDVEAILATVEMPRVYLLFFSEYAK